MDELFKKWWVILLLTVLAVALIGFIFNHRELFKSTDLFENIDSVTGYIGKDKAKKETDKNNKKNSKKTDEGKVKTENKEENLQTSDNDFGEEDNFSGVKEEVVDDSRAYEIKDLIESVVFLEDGIESRDIDVVNNQMLDSLNTYVSVIKLYLNKNISEESLGEIKNELFLKLSEIEDLVDVKLLFYKDKTLYLKVEFDRIEGILGYK